MKFVIDNKDVSVANIPDGMLEDTIPAAVYTVKQSMFGFYLGYTKDRFDEPQKLYGTTHARAQKIKKVYNESATSTSVLLTGLKGAGKSNLMKHTANVMIDAGMPVVILQDPFQGTDFMSFMNSLGECVILLDEFGKTYKRDNKDGDNDQHQLLTFFDGVYSTKCLMILAENHTRDVDTLFIERPSRVLFHWEYDRLEEEVVQGYCEDNLKTKDYLKSILNIYYTSTKFTFDSLQAVVTQCNMFDGDEFEGIIDGLNIPLRTTTKTEVLSVTLNNAPVEYKLLEANGDRIDVDVRVKEESDDWEGMYTAHIYEQSIVSIVGGITTYKVSLGTWGEVMVVAKEEQPAFNFNAF